MSSSSSSSSKFSQRSISVPKTCWICLDIEEENEDPNLWVSPCKCKVGNIWVHQPCILVWISVKQDGDFCKVVRCPECRCRYHICSDCPAYLQFFRRIYHNISSFSSSVLYAGYAYSFLWSFGAISVLQVYGRTEGVNVLKNMRLVGIFGGLPFISVLIVASHLINWEEPVSKFLRTYVPETRVLKDWMPLFKFRPKGKQEDQPLEKKFNLPLRLSSALVFPTVSVAFGNVFFKSVPRSLKRVVLGGLLYLFIKSSLKLILIQGEFIDRNSRKAQHRRRVIQL
ncbi:E3 ubiquitin-protein ligase MARCHF5-like [Artemia franciscana]|uniref:E3 ubiquitin-protein ligase MARCHF5-like n=1 Tax=Artemia franciscana TaxID=6661 RepID=UPI0032DA8E55